jgi:hypothetical protein
MTRPFWVTYPLDPDFDDDETVALIEMFAKEIAETGVIKGDSLAQIAVTLPTHQR